MKRTDDQIRCQFFKELSAGERLKVLRVFLNIPDAAAAEVTSHSIEAKLLSTILRPAPAVDAQPAAAVPERMAPVQGYKAGIPWSLHLEAYDAYSKKWAPQQALIEGGCRGGFGTGELDEFIPGWREKAAEIGRLRARIATLEAAQVSVVPDATEDRARLDCLYQTMCVRPFIAPIASKERWIASIDAAVAAIAGVAAAPGGET
jgi:hypothetical protein